MRNKKQFVVPVLVTVMADNYKDAVNDTMALLGSCQFNYDIPGDFERDNDNQRVIYLHNEEDGI